MSTEFFPKPQPPFELINEFTDHPNEPHPKTPSFEATDLPTEELASAEPGMFDATIEVEGASIPRRVSLVEIAEQITIGADRANESLEKSLQVSLAINEVLANRPDVADPYYFASLVGYELSNFEDLAAAACEYAFAEEEFFLDLKAEYAQNFILYASNYIVSEVDEQEKAQRLAWIKRKISNIAQSYKWVDKYHSQVVGHPLDPQQLENAVERGKYLLSLAK